jgi:hypothetical protein
MQLQLPPGTYLLQAKLSIVSQGVAYFPCGLGGQFTRASGAGNVLLNPGTVAGSSVEASAVLSLMNVVTVDAADPNVYLTCAPAPKENFTPVVQFPIMTALALGSVTRQ